MSELARVNMDSRWRQVALFVVVSLAVLVGHGHALILKGHLTTDSSWKFIGKFCFLTQVGLMQFQVQYPESYHPEDLLLYYDNQWVNVYPKPSMSCQNKLNNLNSGQDLPLSPDALFVSCTSDSGVISCTDKRSFIGARPRFWFVVLSRCSPDSANITGMQLTYNFVFTNGNDPFHKHFSADELGIFETAIAMTIYYFILVAVGIVAAVFLYSKRYLHVTFRLFIVSLVIEFVYFLFYMSEYAQFSSSGISTTGLLTIARVLDAISQIIFLVMLILVAKGYTVTRGRLRNVTWAKIAILFSIYVLAYVIAFICAEVLIDPGLVTYYFSTPAGIAVVCIKVVFGWAWFIYSIAFTIKNYPEKRKFYIFFLVIFSLWFWAGPLVIIACNYLISDFVRNFVAFLVQSIIIALGHTFFLILTRPTPGNKMFPYHVRTSQIGLGKDARSEKQNFPHHKEDESGNKDFNISANGNTNLAELFMVRNTGDKYRVEDKY